MRNATHAKILDAAWAAEDAKLRKPWNLIKKRL